MKRTYYDITKPQGYASVDKLAKAAKEAGFAEASLGKVRKWLQSQESYGVTVAARTHYNRAGIPVSGLDYRWECDLFSFESRASDNDDFKWVLLVVDEFSRYAWTAPLKRKTGAVVRDALASIFSKGRVPTYCLKSDMGMEFRAREVKALLKRHNIWQNLTYNETHAPMVERLVRTIKGRLMKYMHHRQTNRWLDVLEDATKAYNNSMHRSLGMTPMEVTPENEDEVRIRQYLIKNKPKREKKEKKIEITPPDSEIKEEKKRAYVRKKQMKFKVGDMVRISYLKGKFSRFYDQQFSSELFYITKAYRRPESGIEIYTLEDWLRKEVKGTFYKEELQKASEPEDFPIEKVIRKGKKSGKTRYYVKFRNWDKRYNDWVEEDKVRDLI